VNATGVGDLHVRVQLWTPDKLSPREEQLVRELATAGEGAPTRQHHKGLWDKMKEALGA
jgi:molecular chaperone DnaJ